MIGIESVIVNTFRCISLPKEHFQEIETEKEDITEQFHQFENDVLHEFNEFKAKFLHEVHPFKGSFIKRETSGTISDNV